MSTISTFKLSFDAGVGIKPQVTTQFNRQTIQMALKIFL